MNGGNYMSVVITSWVILENNTVQEGFRLGITVRNTYKLRSV